MEKDNKKDETISCVMFSQPENFGSLGKKIHISPKANISINKPGYRVEYMEETVSMTIGIGKDHIANFVMPKSAWEALKNGAEVDITTTKEFKSKFL